MKILRPGLTPLDLRGWFLINFDPGIMTYLTEELKLTRSELEEEFNIWRSFTSSRIPRFYPGFLEVLYRYREKGGLLAIVSHSQEDLIRRDYMHNSASAPLIPDIIYGWVDDNSKRKPSPWPVQQILAKFQLLPEEVLIIDDLKPGVQMSRAVGTAVAAAGWGHDITEIREYMTENCLAYFKTVEDFAAFIFES
ncbi:hypothetical protein ES707_22186 [subsurface metagenome]